MAGKSKQEKHRLKRQKRQAELRKQRNTSPLQSLRPGEGTIQVFITSDWQKYRQASIFVLREVRGRRLFAGFLVDQGVAGLKDTWVILDVGVAEFDDMLAMNSSVSPMRSCSIESARLLIAGAIRYAHDNGFILPCDMDRALKIIDGVGDWRTADTSQFVPEFAGSYRDLQRRSIGQPAEEFLKRKDIRFIINDDMPSLLDEEDDYRLTEIQDALDDVAALAEAYRPEIEAWCAATNEPLHPEYAMGTATLFGAKMLSDDLNGEQTPDETLEEILATCPADMQTEIRDAINQFSRFLRECGTKELVNRVRTRLGRAASASPTS